MKHRSLCLALLLTGCAAPSSAVRSPAAAPEDYYPLAVGNHWTYSVNFLGDRRERRVEIIGHRDGYYLDSEGGQLTVDGLGVRDQKRYLLREPIHSGASWTNVVSASSVEHYQITEVGQTCRAPAGVFENCVRVQSRNRMDEQRTLVNELTFAPSVGIVRLELSLESNGKRVPQSTFELKEFAVKRAPTRVP